MKTLILILLFIAGGFSQKKWQSSYETSRDFRSGSGAPWYVEAGPNYGSLMDTTMENSYHGLWADKHWINPDSAPRDIDNESTPSYKPFRAYRTIQLHKSPILYMRKALIQFYAWTDINLQTRPGVDDWLSLATLTCDTSDNWARTILVNLTTDGYIRLVHVPNQGEQVHIFQSNAQNNKTRSLQWKHKKWNRIDIYLDTDSLSGKAIVWLNKVKVSEANVRQCQFGNGFTPFFVAAHFGLYAAAALTRGIVYNDKIRFIEVTDVLEAQTLIQEPW